MTQMLGPRGLVERFAGTVRPELSLCTMVTDWAAYDAWRASFGAGGFDDERCEFLVVDNSADNRADAYDCVNEFLQAASAPFVVVLHQDVRLIEHGFDVLIDQLAVLERIDPAWAICGNAGARSDSWPVMNLSHPVRDRHVQGGPFPTRVMTLDEDLLVVKRAANLAVSRDLGGFHHYGADLCLIADVLGWRSYVIDFYLRHESGGTFDDVYTASRRRIAEKYARAFRPRWVEVVSHQAFWIGPSKAWSALAPLRRKARKALGLMPRTGRFDRPGVRYPPSPDR